MMIEQADALDQLARPYCERLANAGEGRFIRHPRPRIDFRDRVTGNQLIFELGVPNLFAFFGALAEEFGIRVGEINLHWTGKETAAFYAATREERTEWHKRDRTHDLIESIMSAVCEAVERQQRSRVARS